MLEHNDMLEHSYMMECITMAGHTFQLAEKHRKHQRQLHNSCLACRHTRGKKGV